VTLQAQLSQITARTDSMRKHTKAKHARADTSKKKMREQKIIISL
jgi:hypothetical protein